MVDVSKDEIEVYGNMINDLVVALNMWIHRYPFDEDHIEKQKMLIDRAYVLIGTPRTVEEMKEYLKLENKPESQYNRDVEYKRRRQVVKED